MAVLLPHYVKQWLQAGLSLGDSISPKQYSAALFGLQRQREMTLPLAVHINTTTNPASPLSHKLIILLIPIRLKVTPINLPKYIVNIRTHGHRHEDLLNAAGQGRAQPPT